MSVTPRAPRPSGQGREASLVFRTIDLGKAVWAFTARTRPVRAYGHFVNVGGGVLTAGMSYQALFAVFAALWVGFGAFGAILHTQPEMLSAVVKQINLFVPGLVGKDGAVSLTALLQDRGFGVTRIIASVSLLLVAVAWFTGTRRSIRLIFSLEVRQYRNAVLLKLHDFLLAIGFAIAILASAALTLIGADLSSGLLEFFGLSSDHWLVGGLGNITRLSAMYVFDVALLMAIHRWLAEVHLPRWALLRGCAMGAIGMLGIKVLGGYLLGGASSNPLLASFAVLIGLLIWFNLICRMLLLTSSWIAVGQDRTLGLPAPGTIGGDPLPVGLFA